jgi:hypothetical protein
MRCKLLDAAREDRDLDLGRSRIGLMSVMLVN